MVVKGYAWFYSTYTLLFIILQQYCVCKRLMIIPSSWAEVLILPEQWFSIPGLTQCFLELSKGYHKIIYTYLLLLESVEKNTIQYFLGGRVGMASSKKLNKKALKRLESSVLE